MIELTGIQLAGIISGSLMIGAFLGCVAMVIFFMSQPPS